MKKFICFFAITLMVIQANSFAKTEGPLRFSDAASGTKISVWIPGFLIKMAAGFIEEDEDVKDLIRQIGSVSVTVLEGSYYFEKNFGWVNRKVKGLKKHKMESLVKIQSGNELVEINMRVNKRQVIKRIAILVDDGKAFVLLNLRCRIQLEDLSKFINHDKMVTSANVIESMGKVFNF